MRQLQWFNQPEEWDFDGKTLTMFVTPQTDYWQESHYGFKVDDGPFFFEMRAGEFEVSVKIIGDYQTRFDQMGLMLRKDEKTWLKAGVEFVNDKINISAVVTHQKSDWSMVELPDVPPAVWLKIKRQLDAVEMMYSLDGQEFKMYRLAYFPDNTPLMVGMMAASPDGQGFEATFDDFTIKHCPDSRRLKWLAEN
jgi:uncharacterized protein